MRLLVVEDDGRLAELLLRGLTEMGHAVDVTSRGDDALDWLATSTFDAMVLDVMLPGKDGIEVCQTMRAAGNVTPVLMLTAKDTISDRVIGLDAGADDYLVKPFAFAELVARLRALARRPAELLPSTLKIGDVELDPTTRNVSRRGRPVALSNKEFQILEYLMHNHDRVVTRTMIGEHIWSYDLVRDTNVIDVHVRSLRTRLDDPYPGLLIQTVRGVGYRFQSPTSE